MTSAASVLRVMSAHLLFLNLVAGGTLNVPGDYATVQEAVDAALDDDVILIEAFESCYQTNYGQIVIDKPLTLIGVGVGYACFRVQANANPWPPPIPAIELAGPGYGTVRLVRVSAQGVFQNESFYDSTTTVVASGFDQLVIDNCVITGSGVGGPDANISSYPAIDASQISHILVSNSEIIGGRGNVTYVGWFVYASPAMTVSIDALTVIDSVVLGGDGDVDTVVSLFYSPPPWGWPLDGLTGPAPAISGLENVTLWSANSVISEGQPSVTFYEDWSFDPPETYEVANSGPMEPPLPDTMANNLRSEEPVMILGSSWPLTWDTESPVVILAISPFVSEPLKISVGWLFLDPTTLISIATFGGMGTTANLAIPTDTNLVGLQLAFQVFDPQGPVNNQLSRPVVASVLP